MPLSAYNSVGVTYSFTSYGSAGAILYILYNDGNITIVSVECFGIFYEGGGEGLKNSKEVYNIIKNTSYVLIVILPIGIYYISL